jgi:carbamoyl-phosphate synthase large subunit
VDKIIGEKMKPLRILVTGAGAPGIKGTIFSLINNYDKRRIYIVGTDAIDNVIGKYLCDKFFVIPKASCKNNYLKTLKEICKKEKIDVIIPQNTSELSLLAKYRKIFSEGGVKIIVSGEQALSDSNNKFNLMSLCRENDIPCGKFFLVTTRSELKEKAKELGWPENKIVLKPPISNGMRGVRIIDEKFDKKTHFYQEKPSSLFQQLDDIFNILGDEFPELIVTEYLPGTEYTVDVLHVDTIITVIPRKRELIRSGITFNGITENNKKIINYSENLTKILNLQFCFGFQFKLDRNNIPKILESNPRVQGTMVLSTFAGANIIYSAVKYALGEPVPNFEIKWGTKILRYWGGVNVINNKVIATI